MWSLWEESNGQFSGARNVETGLMADVRKQRELPLGWQCVLFARDEEA